MSKAERAYVEDLVAAIDGTMRDALNLTSRLRTHLAIVDPAGREAPNHYANEAPSRHPGRDLLFARYPLVSKKRSKRLGAKARG